MRTTGVIHLVWAPLGVKPFERFIASYRRHPSGLSHRLTIVYNGFAAGDDLRAYQDLLECLEHRALILPEPAQDIAAYLEAARTSPEDDLCFLNSYSVILDEGWLAKLNVALQPEAVGMVGATGSWESMATNLDQFGTRPKRTWTPRGFTALLTQRSALKAAKLRFEDFPNPHLRTNGFMISRDLLLSFKFEAIYNKGEAHHFESSRHGLSANIARAGLEQRVVDRHGQAWLPNRWCESHTFRAGEQENLLIEDNRTRDYREADEPTRRWLTRLAWGS